MGRMAGGLEVLFAAGFCLVHRPSEALPAPPAPHGGAAAAAAAGDGLECFAVTIGL